MQADTQPVIVAYKGFDKDLKCRGYPYAVGQTFEHEGKVEACGSGFHACEHPLNVFAYYSPAGSRFAEVELSGAISREDNGDTKIAAARIHIKAEISLPTLIQRAVDWVMARCTPEGEVPTGDQGAASSTGDQGAASSTGDRGAASSTGYRGAASSTGDRGAASSTGNQGAASSTGDQGAASSTGYRGAAMAVGHEGRVMGAAGNALFLVERDDKRDIVAVWAGIAGRDGIKPEVWYMLKGGKPVEVSA